MNTSTKSLWIKPLKLTKHVVRITIFNDINREFVRLIFDWSRQEKNREQLCKTQSMSQFKMCKTYMMSDDSIHLSVPRSFSTLESSLLENEILVSSMDKMVVPSTVFIAAYDWNTTENHVQVLYWRKWWLPNRPEIRSYTSLLWHIHRAGKILKYSLVLLINEIVIITKKNIKI